jgi:hypothetical protein
MYDLCKVPFNFVRSAPPPLKNDGLVEVSFKVNVILEDTNKN